MNKKDLLYAIEKIKYLDSKEYKNKSSEIIWKIMRWELLPKKIEVKKDNNNHPFNKFR